MVRRAVLAAIVGTALMAVGSVSLGETPKKPPAEGAGVTYLSPALPTYQPAALFPDAGGSQWGAGPPATIFPVSGKWFLPEHDPLTAYVLDPGFTLPTPAPPPEPLVSAAGALTEGELREVLTEAGWPVELHDEALAVMWCESRWNANAEGDRGSSVGLFQLNKATWFPYAGENPDLWNDPLVNARTAWATYNYDLGRGYAPWEQWSCKP